MALAASDPRHGTANGYSNLKCHCGPCRAAWSSYVKKMRVERQGKLAAGDADDLDTCGYGTAWGCRKPVFYPARLLLNARPLQRGRNAKSLGCHVLFHLHCWPDIATVPAFSAGYAAEDARRGVA